MSRGILGLYLPDTTALAPPILWQSKISLSILLYIPLGGGGKKSSTSKSHRWQRMRVSAFPGTNKWLFCLFCDLLSICSPIGFYLCSFCQNGPVDVLFSSFDEKPLPRWDIAPKLMLKYGSPSPSLSYQPAKELFPPPWPLSTPRIQFFIFFCLNGGKGHLIFLFISSLSAYRWNRFSYFYIICVFFFIN